MLNLEAEKKYFKQGLKSVAGIDEAGRGALAGPVLAATVVIEKNDRIGSKLLSLVNDSKKLSAKQRDSIYKELRLSIRGIGLGVVCQKEVDELNVLKASLKAMKISALTLNKKIDIVLIDGNKQIPNFPFEQKTIIKGDANIFCIAAASIIAKVSRDRIMDDFAEVYSQYGLDKNKGYGTKQHFEMLKKFGPSDIHRRSFYPIKEM